jgi:hypothetical protein
MLALQFVEPRIEHSAEHLFGLVFAILDPSGNKPRGKAVGL